MTLTQYYEERGRLVAEARQILDDLADDADETAVTEAEKRHDAVMKKLDDLDKKIAREERLVEAEKAEEERRRNRRPTRDGNAPAVEEGDERTDEQLDAEYRSAFARYICGVELSAEDRQALRDGMRRNGEEQRIQSTSVAAGGYTVPTTLMNEIVRSMKDWGPMFDEDVARVFSTPGGGALTIPTVNDTASTPTAHTEGTQATDDGGKDVTFGQKTLGAYAYDTEWVRWSWELSEDSIFAMEQLLGSLLGERLARNGNLQLTTGGGVSGPNGIVTASTLGKTAANDDAITADELIDLLHSVNAAYRRSPKCRWQFADSTLAAIRKLKADGATGEYIWQMGDIRVGQPDTLLGKPYSINDDIAAIGAGAKPVIFGDHSKYFVRKVGAVRTVVARERFAPDLGILGLMRLDGELADTAAVKHLLMAAS